MRTEQPCRPTPPAVPITIFAATVSLVVVDVASDYLPNRAYTFFTLMAPLSESR